MFKPTFLYIKQHSVTGKFYFGKTTKDPLEYNGSGKRWLLHLKSHGFEHVTLWYELFTDKDECIKFAIDFSNSLEIVNSEQWLNIIPENGIDGAIPGRKLSNETRLKMQISARNRSADAQARISAGNKGKTRSDETKLKMSAASKGRKMPDSARLKISESLSGRIRSKEHCANQSASMKGNPLSTEHRENISKSLKGRRLSDEHRENLSKSLKKRKENDKTN